MMKSALFQLVREVAVICGGGIGLGAILIWTDFTGSRARMNAFVDAHKEWLARMNASMDAHKERAEEEKLRA